jgi:hypothetical protein
VRAILFLAGGAVLANIVWATFFWRPSAKDSAPQFTTPNSATAQGQEPWMVNEKYNAPGRDTVRKSMLATLEKPWSSFCTPEGRKDLIRTLEYYYWRRTSQEWSYNNTYGEKARQFAVKAWSTTDDNRIERLMRETYGRGYFTLDELKSYAHKPLAELVKDERVTGKPCAG